MKRNIRVVLICILMTIIFTSTSFAFPKETNVSLDKVWRIKFNYPVNPSTVNGNVFIENSDYKEVDCDISYEDDGKTIVLTPEENYEEATQYRIFISEDVKSYDGEALGEYVTKEFSTPLDAPVNLNLNKKISSNSIRLNWGYMDVDYFYIYESDSYYGEYTKVWNYDNSSYQWQWDMDNGAPIYYLPYNSTKYYKITAVKNNVESDFSNIIDVTLHTEEEYINFIKNGHFNSYEYANLEALLGQYLEDPTYTYKCNSYGEDTVVVSGLHEESYMNYWTYTLTFTVNYDEGTFNLDAVNKGGIGGTDFSYYQILDLIDDITSSYFPF